MNKKILKMTVPTDREIISVVRVTTTSLANRMGFGIEEIDDTKIAVSQSIKNILDNTKNENIYIKFVYCQNYIEIELKDVEEEYEKSEIQEIKENSNNLDIYMLKVLMENFKIKQEKEKGTIISMKKRMMI